jgi:hypothetical protein
MILTMPTRTIQITPTIIITGQNIISTITQMTSIGSDLAGIGAHSFTMKITTGTITIEITEIGMQMSIEDKGLGAATQARLDRPEVQDKINKEDNPVLAHNKALDSPAQQDKRNKALANRDQGDSASLDLEANASQVAVTVLTTAAQESTKALNLFKLRCFGDGGA